MNSPKEGRLTGKAAIVTGAASGIGRETALLFARHGAHVLAVDKNGDALAAVSHEAKKAGFRLESFVADLLADDAPKAVFAECRTAIGAVDILANVAGLASDRSIHEMTDADFHKFVDFNLGTTFRLAREAIAEFGDRGGAIVNTSSAVALTGTRGTAPYSAAKAGVAGLTRQLAADYGRRNIRVNAVAPGLIETPATAARISTGVFDELVTKSRPIPRVGKPIDIANAVLFLASDEASFITGVVLPVCGGWTTTRFRE